MKDLLESLAYLKNHDLAEAAAVTQHSILLEGINWILNAEKQSISDAVDAASVSATGPTQSEDGSINPNNNPRMSSIFQIYPLIMIMSGPQNLLHR
jgi:hypothetical protein